MIFSTTSAEILDLNLDEDPHRALFRQLLYFVLGLCLAYAGWKIGYRRLVRWSPALFWVMVILLLLTLIPGVGREVNGAKRWLGVGPFTFQPSEFLKIILPCYFVWKYTPLIGKKEVSLRQFLEPVLLCLIPIFLVLIEPNNGTAAVLLSLMIVLFFLVAAPIRYWFIPLSICLVVGGISATQLPYFTARMQVYLHPELDLRGKGHQPHQAKIAAGSGKVFGKGVGKSLQKLSYLPEAQNDYIAAIYAEEFGFVGMLLLIVLYMGMMCSGFAIVFSTEDPRAYALGGAFLYLIGFQAFMNLGVVSGLLPSTGLNLPLFSQGGSSLMANLAAIGLILSMPSKALAAKFVRL